MRKKWVVVLLSLLLLSCSSNHDSDNGAKVEMKITSVTMEAPAPDMSSPLTFDSEIGVFMESDSGNKNNVCYNRSSSYSWEAKSPIKLQEIDAMLFAYFPYNSKVKSADAIPISSTLGNTSVLYAVPESHNQLSPNWSMVMKPAQATLFVTISKDNTYSGNGDISKVSLSAYGIRKGGKLNIRSGETIADANAGALEFADASGRITSSGTRLQFNIVPASNTIDKQNTIIVCTIDGLDHSVELQGEYAVRYNKELISYINLTLTAQGLVIGDVFSTSEEDNPFVRCKTIGIYNNVSAKGFDAVMQYDWREDQISFEKGQYITTCQIYNVEKNMFYTFKIGNIQQGNEITLVTSSGNETVTVQKVTQQLVWLLNKSTGKGYILAIGE